MDFVSRIDDKLSGLSTSEVAALIAFGVFTVQLLLSFIWPLILIGFISERESAVTWSVVGRIIHNSYWPTVLQTDATASAGVRRRVSAVSYSVVVGAVLVGVAGIVTPLGLYEGIFPSNDATPVQFKYAPDTSALGLGTAPRHDSLGFSRMCYGDRGAVDVCPHSYQDLTTTSNDTGTTVNVPGGYDTRIPKNTYEFFQSGTSRLGRSVSSLFDIEYRTYRTTEDSTDNFTQNGEPYLIGDYRQLGSVLLDDNLAVVEGLVVDTKNGGVGFRNHTVPADDLQYGAQWEEDILFIEPVTECVDTNVTLRFNSQANALNDESVNNVVLVDRGGFVDLKQEFPLIDTPGQEDPELAHKAYASAWANNGWMMLYLNITNPNNESTGEKSFSYVDSEEGRQFRLPVYNSTNSTSLNVRSISVGPYLKPLNLPHRDTTNGSVVNSDGLSFVPPNPWQITTENFTDIGTICQGALGGDYANISNVAGMCGLVTGIPQRTDGSDSVLLEAGSEWDVPLYGCASASRAILKTLSFTVNNTNLAGVQITGIAEKEYRDDSQYPIWAVENSERRLSKASPLWGLAENEDAPFGNVAFKRHPHLWLNGPDADIIHTAEGDTSQNLPGVYFHGMALGVAYSVGDLDERYTGVESLRIYNRWKNLTKTTEGTAKLINLIWTDVAANTVVGTRSQLPRGEPPGLGPSYDVNKAENQKRADSDDDALVPVRIFNRRVKYKFLYAIPAFIVVALVLVAVGFGFVALVFRGATHRGIRSYLTRLSAGRIMTATLLPEGSEKSDGPTEKWLDGQGMVPVDISGRAPRVDEKLMVVDDGESTDGGKGVAPGKGADPASKMLEADDRSAA